jgi:general secretion pathway protein L
LILSADLVYTSSVKIPSKNEEVIRKSIPFAIEEELANNIEDNHFSYSPISEQLFLVSVIEKSILNKIQGELTTNDIKCNQLCSEIFTLPVADKMLSMYALGEDYLIRESYSGSLIKKQALKSYLDLSIKQKQILFIDSNNTTNTLKETENRICKKVDLPKLQAQTLVGKIQGNSSVNLFQGEYQQKTDNKKRINPKRKLAVLTAVLVLSWLSINLYTSVKLSSEIDEIKGNQSTLLLQLIPNASQTEKNDPYSAVNSRLKISENTLSHNRGQGFIVALQYVALTLGKHPKIQAESLRQRNNKLELKLTAQNVSQLNQFQSELEKNALSLRVKTGTRDTVKNGVSAVITMEQL